LLRTPRTLKTTRREVVAMQAEVEAPNVAPHPAWARLVGVDLQDETPVLHTRLELLDPFSLTLPRLRTPAVGSSPVLAKASASSSVREIYPVAFAP
jgi:hypothetical protein